jgi:hypothetical protein
VPSPASRSSVAIACDESGYEGENMVGSMTDVFAHASVRIDPEVATFCLAELRDRIGSPAVEYKAGHLLRRRSRPTLLWFLGPYGPLRGNARVFLVDKAWFVVRSAAETLLGDGAAAAALYRNRIASDDELWRIFLEAANDLVRLRPNPDAVDSFFDIADAMRLAGADPVLDELCRARAAATAYRDQIAHDPPVFPLLDALFPAVLAAVRFWSADGSGVAVAHDRQNTFSAARIAELDRQAAGALDEFRLVDSYADPCVQVADFLAGIARTIATRELFGETDDELSGMLRRYVDDTSIWADERSWSRISAAAYVDRT